MRACLPAHCDAGSRAWLLRGANVFYFVGFVPLTCVSFTQVLGCAIFCGGVLAPKAPSFRSLPPLGSFCLGIFDSLWWFFGLTTSFLVLRWLCAALAS